MNRAPTIIKANTQQAEDDLDISTEPPTKEEIVTAIRSLKSGKAPGQDELNAELFKADPELAAEVFVPLFTAIWERKDFPDDWSEGVIIRIPKKCNLREWYNWRGITLLSIPSKILAKIIIQRISEVVDKQLRKEQEGFCGGRG